MSNILVVIRICIAEDVLIMFLVHKWIAKMMKHISIPAVLVCVVEVRDYLMKAVDGKLGGKKMKSSFPSGSERGDVTFACRCLDKDSRNDCPAEVSGKLVGQGSCNPGRGVAGRRRACGFSKGRGGSGSGVPRNQYYLGYISYGALLNSIIRLRMNLFYENTTDNFVNWDSNKGVHFESVVLGAQDDHGVPTVRW
jgi:hypothetical protein